MPQEYVWSDMHFTHLLVMGQPPHELVECMIGQGPKGEVPHHCLYYSWVSLGETLCPSLQDQFALYILSQET